MIKKILRYARDDLLRVIYAAASKLVQNLEKLTKLYLERREIDFYSYGQPNPKSIKNSTCASVVASTIGDGVQQQLQSASLGLNHPSSNKSIASGQTTPRRPHQPVISSRLATTTNKRGVDEIEMDELEELQALGQPVRKRVKALLSE